MEKYPIYLSTKRCILRRLEIADAEAIFNYANNSNVAKYTIWDAHKSIEDSISYITDYVKPKYAEGELEPFGIVLKEPGDDVVIGTVGCKWISKSSKTMELMYALGESYWGEGIVPEVCVSLLDHCFKEFDVNRIQAHFKKPNKSSARVMEKLGMVFEGYQRQKLFRRGVFWDMGCYSILKQDILSQGS